MQRNGLFTHNDGAVSREYAAKIQDDGGAERRMLILGEFRHTIDQANRLTVPAKYRDDIGADAVLYRAPEGCLFLYSNAEFEKIADSVRSGKSGARSRARIRNFFSDTVGATVDRTGRFIIPPDYLTAANLKNDVVLLGCANHFEIWDAEVYGKLMEEKETASDDDYPDIVF